MAKSTFPKYVQSSLVADRTAQLATVSTLTTYILGELRDGKEVKELAKRLAVEASHRTEATWANYATACHALASSPKVQPKLEALFVEAADVDANIQPADIASAFASWLQAQLKGTYTTSIDDVKRYAKNEPSLKAVALAKQEAEAEKAKALADAAAVVAAAVVAAAPPVAPANNPGDIPNTGTDTPASIAGYAPAISQAQRLMVAFVNAKGDLDIEVESNATRADLVQIMEFLQMQIESMPAEVIAGVEMV